MAAYATEDDLERYLATTFTAAQAAQATAVLQAASDWIDDHVGRSWQGTAPITERHAPYGERVWLHNAPVANAAAITAVTRREPTIGATPTALAAGTGYELVDAAAGEVLVSASDGQIVSVTYTPASAAPPPVVKLATQTLGAHWLDPTLHSERAGLESLALGRGDLALRFTDYADSLGVPPAVLGMLEGLRLPVIA